MRDFIRTIEPTAAMFQSLPALQAAVQSQLSQIEASSRTRSEIDLWYPGSPLNGLMCRNAKRHRDPDFFYVALWVLRTHGHILCAQEKRGAPIRSVPLMEGQLVAFNSRDLWHWTDGGKRMLVLLSWDFFEREPSDIEITRKIEQDLSEWQARIVEN